MTKPYTCIDNFNAKLPPEQKWLPIASAPRDGTRVRLGHAQDPSSIKLDSIFPIHGDWDGTDWCLEAFFIIPGGKYGLITDIPTHWMPLDQEGKANG
jgi:hypothetical protein